MNINYFNLILKKLDELDKSRFKTDLNSWSKGPIKSLEIKLNINYEIRIVCEEDGLKIIMIDSIQRVDSFIHYPFKTAWLSLSWYRWRLLARKFEKIHEDELKRERWKQKEQVRLKELENKQNIEHMMIVIFPEIMENDLLGDDDDK
ncbi:hypothetical protein UFOVP53_135 [uncultured Caudovirales phage]|uniref:Uncharacterized protein n=1 Tax=uncultured Caudovirales phage TaxID=2100421 RepID=A0A6J5KWI5_9CAUD|nr:hypothetical protein UFOVP53_135 [uncultured Caudovirales phage]